MEVDSAARVCKILVGGRVTYAQAAAITGRSYRYLQQQAHVGALSRIGGTRADVYRTWLSRTECEALALASYRRGRVTEYWLTMAEAAQLLGVSRQAAHKARSAGRLPARRSGIGDWLIRRDDALALIMDGVFPRPLKPGMQKRVRHCLLGGSGNDGLS